MNRSFGLAEQKQQQQQLQRNINIKFRTTYLFVDFVSLLTMLILLKNCSSICVALFCVPLFTLAALCEGIRLIFTMSLALEIQNNISINRSELKSIAADAKFVAVI